MFILDPLHAASPPEVPLARVQLRYDVRIPLPHVTLQPLNDDHADQVSKLGQVILVEQGTN